MTPWGQRFLAGLFLLIPAGVTAAETTPAIRFESDILPVFNAHCLQCHGGVHQKNGLDLRTLTSVLKGGSSGAIVVPGKPDESLLWKKLTRDEMPKTDNKVSAADKDRIRDWIAAGALGVEKKADGAVTRAARKPEAVALLIDRSIADRLKADKVPASPRADDAEFLRRVTLDITGRPPTGEAAAAFLADADPSKREKVIDALLGSEQFGRHFAERWINLFYLGTVNQRPPSPGPFIDWMGKQLTDGRRWDEIIRDILTAYGPVDDAPQGLFYYYNADMNGQFTSKILAGNISQVLLGVQLQCAECHNHPFTTWKQTDFWATAAFFAQTARLESVENKMTPGVKEHHLEPRKGRPPMAPKEVSVVIPNDGEARNGGRKVLAAFLDGKEAAIDPMTSHRTAFAAWLTSQDNRMFARAAVNRFWAHFFGRGFVNPLNDFGDHNVASHPDLLDFLAEEFIASKFDVRHLVRCICLSEAYQRTSRAVNGNEKPQAEALFARMTPKVLTPEELYDALCVALGVPDLVPPADPNARKPNPRSPPPPAPRAVFVAAFRGPGEVDEPTELKLGVPHALKLMNQEMFTRGGTLVPGLLERARSPEEAVEQLFLAALARKPTAEESRKFTAFVAGQKTTRDGYARALWALINSSEFLLNH